jgi:ketosteroid isomerase-like protein
VLSLFFASQINEYKLGLLCNKKVKSMTSHSETHSYLSSLYAAYERGNLEPTMEAMADDILFEYVGPADIFPFCGPRRGKAQMLEAIAAIATEFEIMGLNVERILVDEQGYVAILNAAFRNRSTGIVMNCELVDVARTQGDKIVELREYWDVEGVTQQLMGKKLALSTV